MLPLAISYGMTSKEFWEDEPRLFNAYRISFEERQKTNDENAWLIGYYVYIGVQTNLYNAFKESGDPARTYPDTPISWKQQEIDKNKIVEERENKIRARLNKSKKILEEGKRDKGRQIRVRDSS